MVQGDSKQRVRESVRGFLGISGDLEVLPQKSISKVRAGRKWMMMPCRVRTWLESREPRGPAESWTHQRYHKMADGGHSFGKKTFHKPTYCHHCSDLLWGLIGQGYICEGKRCPTSLNIVLLALWHFFFILYKPPQTSAPFSNPSARPWSLPQCPTLATPFWHFCWSFFFHPIPFKIYQFSSPHQSTSQTHRILGILEKYIYSPICFRKALSKVRVWAFNPHPLTFACICVIFHENSRIAGSERV